MVKDERHELLNHLDRCRDLLVRMDDPALRKVIIELMAYLEVKIAAMGAPANCPGVIKEIKRSPR